MEFRPIIYSNAVQSILSIVKAMAKLGISYENPARIVSMMPFRTRIYIFCNIIVGTSRTKTVQYLIYDSEN